MRRALNGEEQERHVPGHEVHWRFALRYEVPELLLALYVRDVLGIEAAFGPTLPPLEPAVYARADLGTAAAPERIEAQWNAWWAELISTPQPAVDLPMDLRNLSAFRSRAELADAVSGFGNDAEIWIAERASESLALRRRGAMVDGGHGELFLDIFGRLLAVEPQQLSFAVTELSVAGDAAIELSNAHFVVSRQFACNIDKFESWLRGLLEERAEALRA